MIKDPGKAAIRISLAVSVLMLAGKLTAYFLTHSTAILGDALESVVHCAATGLAALAYWYAACRPIPSIPTGTGGSLTFRRGLKRALVLPRAGRHGQRHQRLIIWPGFEARRAGLAITGALLINWRWGYS